MSRKDLFDDEEVNVIQEALAAYTDEVMSDDDFYDEEDRARLSKTRGQLIREFFE